MRTFLPSALHAAKQSLTRECTMRSSTPVSPQTLHDNNVWELLPLTAEYIDSEHGGYVQAIEAALENPRIRNIALSGNFGVGKSSILQKVAEIKQDRVVELSLATLAPIEASDLDDSVPKQATTPTNRIQQEIVKQLLYREEPNKAPGSRFRRIERFGWWREFGVASLLGVAITIVFLVAGWGTRIGTTLGSLVDLGLWVYVLLFVVATGGVLAMRYLLYGRIRINQFSAGPAAVTLDEKSVSYFDQYLDEIVYFFEVSKHDIVIFEDIDRFNDSYIFETLRSLNTLLNASPHVGKPIRFIYAIKDSIFDQVGLTQEGRKPEQGIQAIRDPAQAEAARANRTKFFDLVIPVVPFITHQSARSLATRLLQGIEHDISAELIDIAGRYVPDMRLLKNVRNEFIVFRERIFSGDGEQLHLSQTDLFAMMLYKNTHLADFEDIRLGTSNLDQLYAKGRDLVAANIKRIEHEIIKARQRLARLDSVAKRSARFGGRLIACFARIARAAGHHEQQIQYSFNGTAKTEDDLKSTDFWAEFTGASDDPAIVWRNNHNQFIEFTRSDLATLLGDRLDSGDWWESDREEIEETLGEQHEALNFLRSADLGGLIKRPEFLVEYDGSEQSLDAVARQLLTPGLAYQLVRAGYINGNFTLYTSTFHGERVSSAAMNFIIHHVKRDVMDEHFELDGDDVDAVLRECGQNALSESALYNIAILDHLLHENTPAADIIVDSLAHFGDDQTRFLQTYLSGGHEQFLFIQRLTAKSSRVLNYLVSQAELDDETRLKYVDIALSKLADGLEYLVGGEIGQYLETHYSELPSLCTESVSATAAERIAEVFAAANIRVPTLQPLTAPLRKAFVARNLYTIGHENLAIAIEPDTSLALDVIRASNEHVYKYVLENLIAYLSVIDNVSPSIESEVGFIVVVGDVLAKDADRLNDVVSLASDNCKITDIETVSKGAWSVLARYQRFPASFNNVKNYIDSAGFLDDNIAEILASTDEITEQGSVEEDEKIQLAKTILAAREQLPSAPLRAKLVASLQLREYLEVSEIEAENGELFALLVKYDIIADNEATYAHLSGTDWPTRERVIHESKQFKEYITPALVQGDLAELLLSDKVDLTIKITVADRADEFFEGSGKKDLAQLARFANRHERQLAPEVVEQLASNDVPAQDVIILLEPHLGTLSSDRLFAILNSLGGDYPKLTSVGWNKPKIPDTPANRALLEALKRHSIVNTYKPKGNLIKVNKKRK